MFDDFIRYDCLLFKLLKGPLDQRARPIQNDGNAWGKK